MELLAKHPQDLAVVLKHMPLKSHRKAMGAAIAAQAAHRQGKFWEMHALLFQNRRALDRPDLEKYAGELALDLDKFKADLDDPKTKQEVLADQAIALKVGARSTPSSYVNGMGVRGAKPLDHFAKVLAAELVVANRLIDQGTPLAEVYEKASKLKLKS